MVDLNYLDVVVGLVVIYLGIKGLANGFVKEIFDFIGLVGGIYFGFLLAGKVGHWVGGLLHIDNSTLLAIMGFFIFLILFRLVTTMFGSVLSRSARKAKLGALNRLFGFLVGAGKYFLVLSVLVTILSSWNLTRGYAQDYTKDSYLYPVMDKIGTAITSMHIFQSTPRSAGATTAS